MDDKPLPGPPTRDGGMPATRGGNGPQPTRNGRAARRQAQTQERQEAALQRQKERWLKERPSREEVGQDIDRVWELAIKLHDKLGDFGSMFEALRLTLREAFKQSFPEFDATFQMNVQRVMEWREKIIALENGNWSLAELIEQITGWNVDPERLPIRGNSFSPGKVQAKIVQDLDVPKEQKVAFMVAMGYPDAVRELVLQKIEERITPGATPDTAIPDVVQEPAAPAPVEENVPRAPEPYKAECDRCGTQSYADKTPTELLPAGEEADALLSSRAWRLVPGQTQGRIWLCPDCSTVVRL